MQSDTSMLYWLSVELSASVTRSASLLHCHLLAGQAPTLVGQYLLQRHFIYAQRGTRWLPLSLIVYFVLAIDYSPFGVLNLSLFFLVAQSWQTKADRSMWYIQHWVYNGNIVYSYMLCMFVHMCTTHLCSYAVCSLAIVYCIYTLLWLSVLIAGFNINGRPMLWCFWDSQGEEGSEVHQGE